MWCVAGSAETEGGEMIGSRLIWAAAVLSCSEIVCAAAQPHASSADSTRVQQHLTELARCGANPEGGVIRIAYGDADIAGRVYVKSLMEAAGQKASRFHRTIVSQTPWPSFASAIQNSV